MILGEVEETIYQFDEGDNEPKVCLSILISSHQSRLTKQNIKKRSEMMFVRGDSVILISPPNKL